MSGSRARHRPMLVAVGARRAVALACVALLAPAAGCSVADGGPRSAPAPTATTEPDISARAEVTYLPECAPDTLVKRPTSYVLACADGGELLDGLKWRAWGEASATATGQVIVNDCLPDCARGSDITTPVRVVADQLEEGEGAATYRRLTVTADTPGGEGTSTVYQLSEFDPGSPWSPYRPGPTSDVGG